MIGQRWLAWAIETRQRRLGPAEQEQCRGRGRSIGLGDDWLDETVLGMAERWGVRRQRVDVAGRRVEAG